MFCEKCGAQIDKDSKFCPSCGAQATPEAAPAAPVAAPAAPAAPGFFANKKNVRIVAIVAAVVIIGIIAGVIISNLPTTIYMDDFITIEYEGLSTKGTAYMDFDYEAFVARLKTEMTEQEVNMLLSRIENAGGELDIEVPENLKNGDKIQILFSFDNEIAKDYGVQFKLKNPTITVSALQEPIFLDLFADIELTFTGCSPYADVTFVNNSTNEFIKNEVYFYISNDRNLEEGETFVLEASFSQYDAEEEGYIILETSKEYTATNLPKPVELNPFDYIEVVFTGLEGEGKAEVVKSEEIEFLDYISFQFNKSSSLTEGDTITLAFSTWVDDPREYGYTLPETTTKQYTVPKLGKYITDFAELTETGRNNAIAGALNQAKLYLTKESENNRTSYIKLYNTDYSSLNELSYAAGLGNVKLYSVIAAQDEGWISTTYKLCFIFTVDITGHSNIANGGDATGYFYMYLNNPIMKGDGTLEFNFEKSNLSYGSNCFLTYEELKSYHLNSLEVQTPYTPAA